MIELFFVIIAPISTTISGILSRVVPELDADNQPTGAYTWAQLNRPNRIRFAIIYPFGSNPPANASLLQAHIVRFSEARPMGRYYNWALSRAIDYQSTEVLIVIDDLGSFTAAAVRTALNTLAGNTNIVLLERPFGKLVTRRLRVVLRNLDENDNPLVDLKTRITQAGLSYG